MKFTSRLPSRSMRRSEWGAPHRASCVDALEPRTLLSVALQPVQNMTLAQGSAAQTIDLTQTFTDQATGVNDLKFAAQSDNASVVQTSVDANGLLTVTPSPTAGGFAQVTVTATAPDQNEAIDTFRVQVTATNTISIALGGATHQFQYVMSNHTIATINLMGPGSGTIVLGGDNLVQIGNHARGANQEVESISLTGTTAATQLVINGISAKRGRVFADVGNITSDGSLGTIRIKRVFLDGDVNLAGGVSVMNIDLARSGTITFGQSIGAIGLNFGTFTDESLSTPAPFTNIRGGNWYSTDSIPESFQAAYATRIYTSGNFDVGLQLSGSNAAGRSIGSIRALGAIGGTWNVPGSSAPLLIGGTAFDFAGTFASLPYILDRGNFAGSLTIPSIASITVRGTMQNALLDFTGTGNDLGSLHVRYAIQSSAIESAGNLGTIAAEALRASVIYAGVGTLATGEVLPSSASELTASATIQSITLSPRGKVTVGFQGSDIAAATIGNLALGTTQVDNGGAGFGIAAQNILHLNVRDLTNRHTISLSNVHDPATLAAEVAALGFSLQDLTLRILT